MLNQYETKKVKVKLGITNEGCKDKPKDKILKTKINCVRDEKDNNEIDSCEKENDNYIKNCVEDHKK